MTTSEPVPVLTNEPVPVLTNEPAPVLTNEPAPVLTNEPVPVQRGTAPLLLLPVRIETRFMTSDDADQLWLRVYPDQIMANAHHPPLTAAELADGNGYWAEIWTAGNPPPDQDAVLAPWRGLAARYGEPRAAWIRLQTTPVNLAQQPAAPTPTGQAPDPAPQPPDPPVSASAWDSPAVAALLPDAWTVVLDSGTTSVSVAGSPITPGLALSLSAPEPSLSSGFPDGLPVDAGMRWLVDFDTAVAAGMALRIPITAAQRAAGFDRVLVYGTSAAGAAGLATLLDAHHYSDGLTFVPQGTPTKNTADAPSAYSRTDPGALISFAVEAGPALTGDPAADGPVAAGLLGVPVDVFGHVRYADRYDMRDGQDMVTALWPATLGYFLRQLGDGGMSETQIEQARTWTIANMRPRGPLPALAAAQIPYGILPVTSTKLWVADPDDQDSVGPAVFQMVQRLLPTWLASAAGAPHVGATPGDPDTDLAHVLGMDASSMTFRGRHVLGDQLLWNLMSFLGLPPDGVTAWWEEHLLPGRRELDEFSYTSWDPRVIHTALSPTDFPVTAPTVVAGPLSETEPLPTDANVGGQQVNYITWLRSAAIADIRANNYPGASVPDTLLYKILRQSMLLDYVTLAQAAQVTSGTLTLAQTREPELIGVGTAPDDAVVTPWDVLDRPVLTTSSVTWAEYLVTLQPEPGTPFARLAELRTSMDRLAALPTGELDRLLTETLDTCSHRLDAWVTALATSRLTAQRESTQGSAKETDLLTGGYGFVQNLRPATPASPVAAATAAQVADLDGRRAKLYPGMPVQTPPVQAAPGNGGFVQAPSMTQAAAGAVLRSGYLSHQGGSEDSLLAIDLSSDRVRNALYLMAGVQRGQPLGALLGYQLETAMHEADLDVYIQPLRNAYPLVIGKLTAGNDPDAGMSQVVDGLALDRARQAGALTAGADWGAGLPAPGADQNTLLTLFATLDDTVDAISDVGVSEAVYQAMRGNPQRAGGTLDGISQAEHLPEPELVTTPRGGIDYTQRLCALLAGPPAAAAAWAAIPATPRSLAEPWLDAWLSALLPDPATVSATVSYTTAGGTQETAEVTLADLAVRPLDVLAMSRITAQGGRSELDDRLIYQAVPAGAMNVTVGYPEPALPSIGFADLINVARTLADLVAGARALAASDFAPPGTTVTAGIDIADLNGRASATLTAVNALTGELASAAAGTLTPDAARTALVTAAGYGLPGAIPPSQLGSGADPALTTMAAPLHDAMTARATAMAAYTLAADDSAPALSMLEAAFGSSLLVLPRFTPPDPSVGAALAADPAALGATPLALARWRQQLTHVRDGVSRFDLALLLSELVAGGTPLPTRLAQLPVVSGDQWLALPLAVGSQPSQGRLAMVAAVTGDVTDQAAEWAGLYVDGWVERLPNATQSAGVAFNASEPEARAPSVLLLAACPDPRLGWSDTVIVQILRETLELAAARSVDLSSVRQTGQVLPALYFPFNLEQDTVSTPLWPVKSPVTIEKG
jgi:hypothetical protein